MKLLYIANIRLPTEKAHGLQIMKMCEAFGNVGADVVLLVPRRLNTINSNAYDYYNTQRNFRIIYIPTLDFISLGRPGYIASSFIFAISAVLYALMHKTDVVYSRDELPLAISLTIPFWKGKIAWEMHTNKSGMLAQFVCKKCSRVIVITAGLIKTLEALGCIKDNIVVAPDAVDVDFFDSLTMPKKEIRSMVNIAIDHKVIGYVGKYKTMSVDKGVDSLIAAFPAVLNKHPNALLLLVGINAAERINIEKVFSSYGIDGASYRIIEHLPHAEAMQYLKAADILVMNYPPLDHYMYYMSPLKMFEYMASGIPIVTSDLPSIREILDEEQAFFFQAGDTSALAGMLIRALSDPDEAAKKGLHAYQKVREYTWVQRAESIIQAITK